MRRTASLNVVALIAFLCLPPVATASIVGLYGTGFDSGGNPIGSGPDGNWFLDQWPGGGSVTQPAWVIPDAAFPFTTPGWVPNDSSSRWIGFSDYGDTPVDESTGGYSFVTRFSWTGVNPQWITLSGWWSSDNSTQMIFLNGVGTGVKLNDDSAYLAMHPFSFTGRVYPGTNELRFEVQNANLSGSDPVGLRVWFEETVPPAEIPEPATVTFLALGLAALAAGRLRRRRS